MPVLLGQVAGQEGRHGQQDLGPRRERRIGLAGQGPAGFDFGDDPVRIARVPGQAGQQVAAPDFQLRFASVLGTGDAVGGERGRPPVVPKVERRPGRADHHPGLDAGSRRGRDAGRRGQELARFAVPAGGDPPPGQPGGQFPSRLRLGAAERPGQRGADAGLLGGKPTGPAGPLGARQGRLRRPGHLQRPPQQPDVHRGFLAGGGQPSGGELADGLQQRITDHRAGLDLHERLAGQAGQQAGDRLRRQGLATCDPFGHIKVESSAQHRQPGQQAPFGVIEQLIAPGHQRLEGAVPSRAGGAAGQQARVALQAGRELRRAERRAPGRGQLDGQRHAVQPGAHLGDRGRVACGQRERGARRAGPGHEQAAGLGRGNRAGRAVFRQSQRRYGEDEFAGHVQAFPAGGQDAHPAALPGQHDHHPADRSQDVLAVVEHDQQLAADQRTHHARQRVGGISFRELPAPRRRPPERVRHRCAKPARPAARRHRSCRRPASPPAAPAGSYRSPRTGQRHHPGGAQAVEDRSYLRAAAHQRAHLGGQARMPSRET